VTAFGITRADGRVLQQDTSINGIPVYIRHTPQGFFIYVEFKRGQTLRPIATQTFNWSPTDPYRLPDLQIFALNTLGDGSSFVCDDGPAPFEPTGGVPGVNPPVFGGTQQSADAINDLACRFNVRTASGTGPCTRNALGVDEFVSPASELQFCTAGGVGAEIAFPLGDTRLYVRGRDTLGVNGPPASIIIRVVAD